MKKRHSRQAHRLFNFPFDNIVNLHQQTSSKLDNVWFEDSPSWEDVVSINIKRRINDGFEEDSSPFTVYLDID